MRSRKLRWVLASAVLAVMAWACSDNAPGGACLGLDCEGQDTSPIGPDADADDDAPDAPDAVVDTQVDGGDLDADDASEDPDLADATGEPDLELPPCSECHGGLANAAPPVDTQGRSDPALRSVGAHQTHLRETLFFRTVECTDCHEVPTDVDDPGHLGDLPAEVQFGPLAGADGVEPDYAEGRCTVYCHGVTLSGGTDTLPDWTTLDGTFNRCGACHGIPPTEAHPRVAVDSCLQCHPFEGGPVGRETHVDGHLDVTGGSGECGSCHGLPPDSGAHRAHVAIAFEADAAVYGDLGITRERFPDGVEGYSFGCGNCHPTDVSAHFDGEVEVELHDAELFVAPPYGPGFSASLKARNPASASFDGATCSDVYCHSTGQADPVFVETPAWDGGSLPEPRCAACHDNPPAYASGGAGTTTANTHLVMADDGYEYGHFGGFPGPWHTSYHGGQHGSAPITCQTCHFATVDPENTGPSGFYYLDTTGDYDAGGDLGFSCTAEGCHAAGDLAAPTGEGAVLTARHVDGARDVVFDPRASLPSGTPNLPDPPPPYPYWVGAVPNASVRPAGSDVAGGRWSFHLGAVDLGDTVLAPLYDPEAKTCTTVPCHLRQSYAVPGVQENDPCLDGREGCSDDYEPLQWGVDPVGWSTCNSCHQF